MCTKFSTRDVGASHLSTPAIILNHRHVRHNFVFLVLQLLLNIMPDLFILGRVGTLEHGPE